MAVSQTNGYALRRFALKLGLLMVFALTRWPEGIAGAARKLSLLTALADVVLALVRRQPVFGRTLTYWDEAAMFALIFLLLSVVAP